MKSIQETGEIYQRFYHAQAEPFNAVKQLEQLLLNDLCVIWGAKLNAHGDRNIYKTILNITGVTKRGFITSVFAAEVFPDRTPPRNNCF